MKVCTITRPQYRTRHKFTQIMNPYEILGVGNDFTKKELKSAYRDKAKASHPDHGGDKEEFQRVAKAYETLSNPAKREVYDLTGDIDEAERWENTIVNSLVDLLTSAIIQDVEDYLHFARSEAGKVRDRIAEELVEIDRRIKRVSDGLARITLDPKEAKGEQAEDDPVLLGIRSAMEILQREKRDRERTGKFADEMLRRLKRYQCALNESRVSPPLARQRTRR